MALALGKFKGAVALNLATVLGFTGKQFRQFILYGDPDNTGNVFMGYSNVTGVPANEFLKIKAGVSINLGPDGAERPYVVDTGKLYLAGSDANQIVYVITMTEEGR